MGAALAANTAWRQAFGRAPLSVAYQSGGGQSHLMGWSAKPGSAEDKLQQWLTTKNITFVMLCFSVFYAVILAWEMTSILRSHALWVIMAPLSYGAGAAILARSIRKTEKPTRLQWALAAFFSLLALVQSFGRVLL